MRSNSKGVMYVSDYEIIMVIFTAIDSLLTVTGLFLAAIGLFFHKKKK